MKKTPNKKQVFELDRSFYAKNCMFSKENVDWKVRLFKTG